MQNKDEKINKIHSKCEENERNKLKILTSNRRVEEIIQIALLNLLTACLLPSLIAFDYFPPLTPVSPKLLMQELASILTLSSLTLRLQNSFPSYVFPLVYDLKFLKKSVSCHCSTRN